ncbi:MAG TPA: SemiSWEET transporter [Stellaceae bacterium]|nr:SemiSWEET transporter [Stellaceae bacterium]
MNSFYATIGLAAASCTTLAFVPQVIKTWRSGHADDISLGWLAIFIAGMVLWLIYGLWLVDLPLIASNLVTLALVLVILYVKLRNMRTRAMPGE